MALPIKETPILKGKDAILFMQRANNPIKVDSKIRKRIHKNYLRIKKIEKIY